MAEDTLFVIDIDVSTEETEKAVKPSYTVDHSLVEDAGECSSEDESNATTGDICWNCDKSGHGIRDCKEPFNHQRVAQNRKKFMNNKTSNNKRYHDDKFARFRPGVFSKSLRKALNLRSDEVPKHIYAMRTLGYPPGWLAEARLSSSGINMYNTSGKRIPEPDEEEGEIIIKSMKYDVEKIIEYPGFNVPLREGSKDDHYKHGYPPMRSDQSKDAFIKYLEEVSAREVSIENEENNSNRKSKDRGNRDNERIDVRRKVMKIRSNSNIHSPRSPNTSDDDEDGAVATCSLPPPDRMKASSEDTPNDPPPEEPPEGHSEEQTEAPSSPTKSPSPVAEAPDQNPTGNGVSVTPAIEIPSQNDATTPVLGSIGTPHVKTHSPFTKLPSFDKFNKDISDVIDFENLPDSVGKYSTMCSLIEKIRTHMASTKNSRKSNSYD